MLFPFPLPMDIGAGVLSTNMLIDSPDYPKTFYSLDMSLSGFFRSGTDADFQDPQAPVYDTGVGHLLPGVHYDWYYRIHFTPAIMALGNLPGDQQRSLNMWNAFLVPVEVTVEEMVNGTGISYTASVDLPGTLPALAVVDYSFLISANGPPVIRADMTWVIDGVTYTVPFDGRRAVMLAFGPNWSSAIRETYEWKTSVDASYSGIEQIMSIRRNPRLINDYSIREHKDSAKLFDLLTFGWQGRMYVSPMWTKRAKLSAEALTGATVLNLVDANYRGFVDGMTIVLRRSSTEYEIQQIDVIAGNVITLTGALAADWPAGSRVYPCMTGRIANALSTERAKPDHVDTAIRFEASPTDTVLVLPDIAAEATYLGDELYLKETNWRSGLPITITPDETVADEGTGPFQVYRRGSMPKISRGFSWMCKTRAQAWDLLGFFVRRRGRAKPVWMPSGTEDFVVSLPSTLAEQELRVRPSEYGTLLWQHPARRHIVIFFRGGTYLVRRIDDTVQEVGYTSLVLDSPFGVGIDPADIKRVSFLGWYRLGSDSITFDWHTDEVAEVTVNFVLKEPRT